MSSRLGIYSIQRSRLASSRPSARPWSLSPLTALTLAATSWTFALRASSGMELDPEGFDPYKDTVGAGIYSGKVKRDADGNVIIGKQYQNHNPVPGPVYAGNGYTEMSNAIHAGPEQVKVLLAQQPHLVKDIATGGATPLHTCGMSRTGQLSTQVLIDAGGDIEALDTYGYTPLHRMASNNLAIGAEVLLKAGADPNRKTQKPYDGDTPMKVARQSGAKDVIKVLQQFGAK